MTRYSTVPLSSNERRRCHHAAALQIGEQRRGLVDQPDDPQVADAVGAVDAGGLDPYGVADPEP